MGARGTSSAVGAYHDEPVALEGGELTSPLKTILTLTLPEPNVLVIGKVTIAGPFGGYAICRLLSGGSYDQAMFGTTAEGATATMTLLLAEHPGTVQMRCIDPDTMRLRASNIKITAIAVDSIVNTGV